MSARKTTQDKAREYAAGRQTDDFVNDEQDANLFADLPQETQQAIQKALTIAGDSKGIAISDLLHLSPVSLDIAGEIDQEQWLGLLQAIEMIKRKYQWYLGDMLRYGVKRKYGETKEQLERIAAITGKGRVTLQYYYNTARLFENVMRVTNCSFEAHKVIAIAFPDDSPEHAYQRKRWLQIAAEKEYTSRELYFAIHPSEAPDLPPLLDTDNRKRFMSMWQKAATGRMAKITDDEITLMHQWLDKLSQNVRDARKAVPQIKGKKSTQKKKRVRRLQI